MVFGVGHCDPRAGYYFTSGLFKSLWKGNPQLHPDHRIEDREAVSLPQANGLFVPGISLPILIASSVRGIAMTKVLGLKIP